MPKGFRIERSGAAEFSALAQIAGVLVRSELSSTAWKEVIVEKPLMFAVAVVMDHAAKATIA